MDMYLGYMNELGWTKCRGMGEVTGFFRKLTGIKKKVKAELELKTKGV